MPKRFQAGTFCQFWFWTWWIALPLQLRPLKCHHFAEGQPGSTAGGRKVWGLVLRSKVTFNAVPPSNMASAGAQLGTQRRSPHARQVSVRCLELREFLDRIWYALLYVALIISHHPSHSKLSDPPRRPFTIAATAAVGRSSATSARSNSSGPTRCSPAAAAPAVTAGATGQTRSAAAAPTSPWAWRTPPQRWRKGNGACPERWDMRLGHPWKSLDIRQSGAASRVLCPLWASFCNIITGSRCYSWKTRPGVLGVLAPVFEMKCGDPGIDIDLLRGVWGSAGVQWRHLALHSLFPHSQSSAKAKAQYITGLGITSALSWFLCC